MKIFKNKFLVKLIASICLFLTLLNFGASNKVYAEDDVWGGVLIKPIVNLMVGICDAIMKILHESILSQDEIILQINGSTTWWETVGKIILAIVVVVVAVAVAAAIVAGSGGLSVAVTALGGGKALAAAFVAGAVPAVFGGIAAGAATAYTTGVALKRELFPDIIYLPYFTMSVEEIFRDEIFLFDVNFFREYDPSNPNYTITEDIYVTSDGQEIPKEEKWFYKEYTGTTSRTTLGYTDNTILEEGVAESISGFPDLAGTPETYNFIKVKNTPGLAGFENIFNIINAQEGTTIIPMEGENIENAGDLAVSKATVVKSERNTFDTWI